MNKEKFYGKLNFAISIADELNLKEVYYIGCRLSNAFIQTTSSDLLSLKSKGFLIKTKTMGHNIHYSLDYRGVQIVAVEDLLND